MIYVHMTDNFMSGWGGAEGKTNKYVIECDTQEQADQIEKAARTRDEMSKITVSADLPYWSPDKVVVSQKPYSDLGGMWIEDGGRL